MFMRDNYMMALRDVFSNVDGAVGLVFYPKVANGVCRVCCVAVSDVLALSHCISLLHVSFWKPVHSLGIRSMCYHRRRRRRLGRMVTMLRC